ncbi:unnamed protein product [Colletotrichum noveboracense]|uniref:Uncharacterized protein n=1 Tax=Colletotrichum noveboracense TaxID=2664923 RepID=A0A9W4WJ42_9PEZI|nr:unnamed protein product [Colletotrichum noveboracense]
MQLVKLMLSYLAPIGLCRQVSTRSGRHHPPSPVAHPEGSGFRGRFLTSLRAGPDVEGHELKWSWVRSHQPSRSPRVNRTRDAEGLPALQSSTTKTSPTGLVLQTNIITNTSHLKGQLRGHDESQVEKEARSPSQAQEKKDEGSLQINNSHPPLDHDHLLR